MFESPNLSLSTMSKDLTKNQILDYKKWYLDRPEKGFSPERNKKVIELSIAKSRLLAERRNKDYIEQIRERADAVASFLKFVDRGGDDRIDRYLGKKWLAHMRGQQIVEEVKGRMRRLISND